MSIFASWTLLIEIFPFTLQFVYVPPRATLLLITFGCAAALTLAAVAATHRTGGARASLVTYPVLGSYLVCRALDTAIPAGFEADGSLEVALFSVWGARRIRGTRIYGFFAAVEWGPGFLFYFFIFYFSFFFTPLSMPFGSISPPSRSRQTNSFAHICTQYIVLAVISHLFLRFVSTPTRYVRRTARAWRRAAAIRLLRKHAHYGGGTANLPLLDSGDARMDRLARDAASDDSEEEERRIKSLRGSGSRQVADERGFAERFGFSALKFSFSLVCFLSKRPHLTLINTHTHAHTHTNTQLCGCPGCKRPFSDGHRRRRRCCCAGG
jgi:hypothetical protein